MNTGFGGVVIGLSFSSTDLKHIGYKNVLTNSKTLQENKSNDPNESEGSKESNWERERGIIYWEKPELPDENIFFTEQQQQVINQIMTAYNKFVETGYAINKRLVEEFSVSRG